MEQDNVGLFIQEEGVVLNPAKVEIPWSDIVDITLDQSGPDSGTATKVAVAAGLIALTGGLAAAALPFAKDITKKVQGDAGPGQIVLRGGLAVEIDWISGNVDAIRIHREKMCTAPLAAQLKPGINSLQEGIVATEDLVRAHEWADQLRIPPKKSHVKEEALFLHDVRALQFLADTLQASALLAGSSVNSPTLTDEEKKAVLLMGEVRKQLEAQFSRVDFSDANVQTASEAGLMLLTDWKGQSVAVQKKAYEERHTALRLASESPMARDEAIKVLQGTDGDNRTLGDAAWKNMRKIIICTDQPMALQAFAQRKRLDGIMVMDAADIVEYNDSARDGERLVFPSGHPENGNTYIQHPMRANLYFEVNEFHDSLLERKQNELLRILEALGAYSARVEIIHEQQENMDGGKDMEVGVKGAYGETQGAMNYSASESRQGVSSVSQSATKDWTFNPPDKPGLPDDLVFYPTEETWMNLKASVLRGGLKRATVDLEYKSEYGITEKRLSDIAASAKSVLPSFEMHLKRGFSANLHRLTTTKWHYEAIFENENGERAGKKGEALFKKRAKRYAQSEGHIDAAQRTDLEAFAKKYGIDEFRMEELIEEAFD